VIVSTDPEKAFDWIHHLFLIKAFNKLGVEGTWNINMIKVFV
jgi:hypothetical protein